MIVTLSVEEITRAAHVGVDRGGPKSHCKIGYNGNVTAKNMFQDHCMGACAELAAANAFGVEWAGSVNTFRKGTDIPGAEVRSHQRATDGLYVRERDKDDSTPYILVLTYKFPEFVIFGWMTGHDARKDKWLTARDPDRPACWVVPQRKLRRDLTPIYRIVKEASNATQRIH